MKCEELAPLLTRIPPCEQTEFGTRYMTDCLYPSSEPVYVYIMRREEGFYVTDAGGAVRSAVQHDRSIDGFLDKASKRHSVFVRSGAFVAEPPNSDWLYPAILAVANASALAARLAVEAAVSRVENSLRDEVYANLRRVVPEHKIASNFEQMGRSGHLWQVDYAVREESLILIKSVVQNGNSINSNYASFGDISDEPNLHKFSVFSAELKQDSAALIRQVAQLVPLASIASMTERFAYRGRLN